MISVFVLCKVGLCPRGVPTSYPGSPPLLAIMASFLVGSEDLDPGWVWSRVSQGKMIPREGPFVFYSFGLLLFVNFKSRPIQSVRKESVGRHVFKLSSVCDLQKQLLIC